MATVAEKCACSLRGRLVGDGCEICNPSLALDYAKERIAELETRLIAAETAMLMAAAGSVRDISAYMEKYPEPYIPN